MMIVRPFPINNAALVSSNVAEADYAAWASGTTYALADRATEISPSATVTITVASPCVVTWTANRRANETPIVFSTTGALPTGLTAGTTYYVTERTTDSFKLSLTPGGTPINTSGTQSGTHTATAQLHDIYESLQGSNTGNGPAISPTYWVKVSATNRWKMFDQSNTSQTSNNDTIVTSVDVIGRADSVVAINLSAASIRVKVTDDIDGVIYDQTTSLVSDSGITDWYAYFFEPIIRVTDIAITDLPPYANPNIEVTLTDTGFTVLCGNLLHGQSKDIGGTLYGATVGIQDYSTKDTNDFGVTTITEREYASRGEFTVVVENTLVDLVKQLLASYRATPVVYIGSDSFGATIIYGIYRDFRVEIRYTSKSICTLDLLGLT